MQTKLKPVFFLITLAATAILLYAANDAGAQQPPKGLFSVPIVPPSVFTISPKISKPAPGITRDSISARLPVKEKLEGVKQ